MPFNAKEIEKWEKTRLIGFWKFVIIHGAISWGILSGLFYFLITSIFLPSTPVTKNLIVSLILFPVTGLFWGMTMWYVGEKRYENAKKENIGE
ncbi:hypothetical protein BMS3Abin05_02383 [bacterium BMS3Abin05]|nr:hypothetical protein BMS3Abin05_02383 [bacterium BMS3Abin05]GBE26708.1 hypothetical protein BMS3Bbin03_00627 [bacterium BMS3Bbin03]